MKRAISLILTLVLALSLAPAASGAVSEAYGSEVWLRDSLLHDGAVLSENIYWSDYYNKPRRETYITYTPDQGVAPAVSYGSTVCDRITVAEAAASYEAEGYRVVGAINGDFYDTASGYPLGLLVSGGEILSGSANYYAVGFRPDGSAIMGKPALNITAYRDGKSLHLAAVNKPRVEGGGVTLLTGDYRNDGGTGAKTPGISVLCDIVDGGAAIGGELVLEVVEVLEDPWTDPAQALAEESENGEPAGEVPKDPAEELLDGLLGDIDGEREDETEASEEEPLEKPGRDGPLVIGKDQVVLAVSATGYAEGVAFLNAMIPGDEVTVTFETQEPGWEDVTEAMGALHLLVENGVAKSDFKVDAAPRTAIGLKRNGDVVFYTIDGRQEGHSMGASMNMLAQRMVELGCETALCLDGGGSTTLVASTPDSDTAHLINSPSDKTQRKVSNHLLLLAEGRPTGEPARVYVSADAPAVLSGHTVELRAGLVDTNSFPMDGEVELTASAGEIVDGTFIAPQEGGPVTITAHAEGEEASVEVLVVDTPDKLEVRCWGESATSLTMVPGDRAEFTAAVTYNHLPLETEPHDFIWTVDPQLGAFDENGVLKTNFTDGEGTVTVSKGNMTVTIPLKLDASTPFVDVEGHWGKFYLASLYRRGVLAGVTVGDQVYAYPDKGVTRAEFSVLLARYLDLNLADYAGVEVPFADMDKVDAWAADAVRAMYAMGIVGGIETKDGQIVFDPQGTLTRSQAVTMLGRLRSGTEETVEPADLSQFTDAGEILAYAVEHFETMVSLGVIGGSYGKLDPNGTMTRAAICKVLATMP